MREYGEIEHSSLKAESEDRCLKKVYAYSRRVDMLLQKLLLGHMDDENLSAAGDHAKSLVWYLREARKNRGRHEPEPAE